MAVRTMGSPDQPVAPQFQNEYDGYIEDFVTKQNQEKAKRVDTRDEFGHADVRITAGIDRKPFTLKVRYTKGGTFAFAVYNENPLWFDYAEQDWLGAARNGLAKFAAERGLTVLEGPRREDLNQYNMMIRTQEVIHERA